MKTALPPFLRQAAKPSRSSHANRFASFNKPNEGTLQPFMFDESRRISRKEYSWAHST